MNADARFDVFQDDVWEPILIASFDEFASAKEAMEKMAFEKPGQYFVWASGEDEIIALMNTGAPWIKSK